MNTQKVEGCLTVAGRFLEQWCLLQKDLSGIKIVSLFRALLEWYNEKFETVQPPSMGEIPNRNIFCMFLQI